ncbi:MAG: MarR family transcriptional regulator, organic hydroperoxide resistance regulator [Micromonosporaceae bacterium]
MADLKVLFSELIRFETELWNAVDARLRSEHDLQLSWFEPMQVMSRCPACRVFDIKAELSITVGGASKLVDRIEAAGLCRRRANPDDRRSQIIELTPAGRRLLAKATRSFEDELQARLESVVTRRVLDQFCATLMMLRAANRPATSSEEMPPTS